MTSTGLSRNKINAPSLLLFGLIFHLLLATHLTMASPVPLRNDIISGQDFLSLFIAENPSAESSSGAFQQQQPRGRSLTVGTRSAILATDTDDQSTASAFEGDLGNDIIPSSDNSEESQPPQSTPLVIQRHRTMTTKSPTRRSTLKTRSSTAGATPTPPHLANKRVIVRKLINVHSLRTTKATRPALAIARSSSGTTAKSKDSNYLDETADRSPPINSHRSESLFIEEADAKDLTNSESMNVPRIVKLPATDSLPSSSPSSSPSTPPAPPQSTRLRMMSANEGVLREADNGSRQRNSPFTLQTRAVAVTTRPSNSRNSSSKRGTDEVEMEEDDLVSNASNNDRLVHEQRMSTSRSRTQMGKEIDTSSSPAAAAATPSSPTANYQTATYGQHQQGANPIRLPVPRSIAYHRREQRINSPVAPSGPLYQAKVYSEPSKVYSEPAKVYSEPAKVYSEPSKVYGQPEKIYSEPAKIYSEPAKVYSEPAKFYSEPAKVYSEPAKNYGVPPTPFPIISSTTSTTPRVPSATTPANRKILFNLDKLPYDLLNAPNRNLDLQSGGKPEWDGGRQNIGNGHMEELFYNSKTVDKKQGQEDVTEQKGPEMDLVQNVEEDEDDGGGVTSQTKSGDNNKTGYVVEGRTYRKYRVEEKTPDGFIVGEYGVVSHNDGNLRGVRYTADSNINPRLIYDALLKFLSL